MKKFKIVGVTILSLLLIIYIAFFTIIPNLVNLNKYKPSIQKIVSDSATLDIDYDDMRLYATPNFSLKILLKNLKIKYPKGNEIINLDKAETTIPLFPIFAKTLRISSVNLNGISLSLNIDEKGHYDLEKYIIEQINKNKEKETSAVKQLPIKYSPEMPKITLKNYIISVEDNKNKLLSKLQGDIIKIDDFNLEKHIKIAANGLLTENDKKQITYNIKVNSYIPQATNEEQTHFELPEELFNPFLQIAKYNFNAELTSDLKITQNKDKNSINGILNLDKISFKSQGTMLPESYLHLNFKNDDIKIDSDFYTAKNEKTDIIGEINLGKKTNIDLSVKNNSVKIENAKNIICSILDVLNIKNDLSQLNTEGYFSADFNIKTDLKKIQSNGKLTIKDAQITHKKLPIQISKIKALLNFENNKIIISDTSANINDSALIINGSIDNMANADIKITTNKLPLAKLYQTFATPSIKETYLINNGALTLNAYIKGPLSKIAPSIDAQLSNLEIKDKNLNGEYKISNLNSKITAQNNKFKGDTALSNISLKLPDYNLHLNASNANIIVDEKNIDIKPITINLDNSKLTFDGKISDYMTNLNFDGVLKGNLNTNSLKSYLSKDIQTMTKNNGSLPMITLITSNGKTTQISAQILANAQNYFSPLEIDEMKYHNSILNIDLSLTNDVLSIRDIGLYSLNNNSELSNNLKTNIANSSQIAYISGKINQLSSKNPQLSGIKASTSRNISLNIPTLTNSSATLNASINAEGNINAPVMKGQASLKNISIPTYKLKANDFNINFDKNAISGNCSNLNLNGSPLSISFNANNDFSKDFIINNLSVNSTYFDLDKILEISANLPQADYAASTSLPVKILNGTGTISKFLMGGIELSNVNSNFTLNNDLLTLTNIKASAYQGSITGTLSYNIAYLTLKALIQGTSMDANKAITAFLGLKDQITGTLGFNADISMTGSTQNQQLRTLKGTSTFNIQNGQMGNLGKLEYYLHAQNLITSKLFNISINSLINAISPKNTGKFSYLSGDLSFKNGYVYIFPILSSGPNMSLYMEGSYNLLNNLANIELLGRLSQDVHKSLGIVGDLSISKLLSSGNTKFGTTAAAILQNYNLQTSAAQLNKIPALTPNGTDTKEFAVQIQGNIENVSAVKSFKWLTTQNLASSAQSLQIKMPKAVQNLSNQIQNVTTNTKTQTSGIAGSKSTTSGYATQKNTEIPDFIKSLPDSFKSKGNN